MIQDVAYWEGFTYEKINPNEAMLLSAALNGRDFASCYPKYPESMPGQLGAVGKKGLLLGGKLTVDGLKELQRFEALYGPAPRIHICPRSKFRKRRR